MKGYIKSDGTAYITTEYGDPYNPGIHANMWVNPFEEKQMRKDYHNAVKRGEELPYTVKKENATRKAEELHQELIEENEKSKRAIAASYFKLPGRTNSGGGSRTRKQKRNHKQKTRKQRKQRKNRK